MAARDTYATITRDPAFLAVLAISVTGTLGTNVLAAALPGITAGLEVADAQVGLVLSVYKLAAMVLIPVTTVGADLYGRRPVIMPSLVLFGAAGVAMGAVESFVELLALSVVLGAGFAGFMPISIALVGDLYTGPTGSAAQGIRTAVNGAGGVAFPAATGFLAGLAWNRPFVLFALVVPAGVLAFRFIPERAERSRRSAGLGRTLRSYAVAVRVELTQSDMAVLLGGGFLRDLLRLGVVAFVPLFAVRSLDASLLAAGAVLSLRGIASIVVSPTLGVLVATFSRKRVLVVSFAIAAVGIVAVPLAPTVLWLGVAFGTYSIGDALASPIVKDTVSDTASETHRAGVVGGLTVVKNAGQAIGPALFGAVIALSSIGVVFRSAAALAAIYGVVLYVVLDPSI